MIPVSTDLTTTTNAKGQTQRETRNALDEVIETRDHAGTTVRHTYDAWGQVTKTVVAGRGVSAVTTTMKYDKRGRRTRLNGRRGSDHPNYLLLFGLYADIACYFPLNLPFCHQKQGCKISMLRSHS